MIAVAPAPEAATGNILEPLPMRVLKVDKETYDTFTLAVAQQGQELGEV